METEIDTKPTDIAIVPGRTASERLLMDINEEIAHQNKYVDRYKGDKQQQFIELRARGASYQNIAKILHCGESVYDDIEYKDAIRKVAIYTALSNDKTVCVNN